MKKYVILLFVFVALAQLLVPAQIIWSREQVLRKGKSFRFQTEPVDPEDPLRGRYVHLDFKADQVSAKRGNFEPGDYAFAEIGTDAAGYARIIRLHYSPPPQSDYVKVKLFTWLYSDESGVPSGISVEYPFEKFFLDEYKAPEAERIYRSSMADSAYKTYAIVNIYNGKAVIKDLVINDKSIYSYFK